MPRDINLSRPRPETLRHPTQPSRHPRRSSLAPYIAKVTNPQAYIYCDLPLERLLYAPQPLVGSGIRQGECVRATGERYWSYSISLTRSNCCGHFVFLRAQIAFHVKCIIISANAFVTTNSRGICVTVTARCKKTWDNNGRQKGGCTEPLSSMGNGVSFYSSLI